MLRITLRLGIWDKGAQIHRQCPGLTELGCLALALLEELAQGSNSQRWPWLRVSCPALQDLILPQPHMRTGKITNPFSAT